MTKEYHIHYKTVKGTHITKCFHAGIDVISEIKRLWKRRTEAEARDHNIVIGAVWKNEGVWTFFYEEFLEKPF